MHNSQSHMFSLATLLESAEKRHSATPPAPPVAQKDDSGLIDILAMQRRAREERVSATATPLPVVSAVRGAESVRLQQNSQTTDPDFVAVVAAAHRRKKQLFIGAIAGAVALVALAVGVASSGSAPAPAPAVAAAAVVAKPSPPPILPPPPAVEARAPEPVAPVAAEPVASSAPASKKAKHKVSHSSAHGPKMMKVTSSGTSGTK